jgi:hypothetical protein
VFKPPDFTREEVGYLALMLHEINIPSKFAAVVAAMQAKVASSVASAGEDGS